MQIEFDVNCFDKKAAPDMEAYNPKYGMMHWYWPKETAYLLLKKYKKPLNIKILKREWKETGPKSWFKRLFCRPNYQEILNEYIDLANKSFWGVRDAREQGLLEGEPANIYEWFFANEEWVRNFTRGQSKLTEVIAIESKELPPTKEIFPQKPSGYML